MSTRTSSTKKLRLEIAEIAARLIAIEGIPDFHKAKRKAALQLGLPANNNLPTNKEIEKALINYQNLFQADSHEQNLKALRMQAIQAMKLLRQYKPLLVGPVLSGTATEGSEITLHLFSDQVEQIGLYLTEQGIPYINAEKHVRINASESSIFPSYNFIAGETSICLVVLSEKDKNLTPMSSIDNKAMSTADLNEVIHITESDCNSIRL
jgi:hypothetical protein